MNKTDRNLIKLNVGCGNIRPSGWINIDSSFTNFVQKFPLGKNVTRLWSHKNLNSPSAKYMNLNKSWAFFKNESVDVVYGSHLFEHLTLKGREIFLNEALRALRVGGVIRIVVPDLELHARKYIECLDKGETEANIEFLWALNLHLEGQYPHHNRLHQMLGFIQGYPHQHKYMYDQYSMGKLLHERGFTKVNKSDFGTSQFIDSIADVEFDKSLSYENSLYMEALKEDR